MLSKNEKQKEAVSTIDGPLLIVAGAGSGKTRVAKYNAAIFDSHWKNETKGIYDEKISPLEAHK